MENNCDNLFPRDDYYFKGASGCLREGGHLDEHVCKSKDGKYIAWDYDWTCGCEDCRTDSLNDMCIVYWEVQPANYNLKTTTPQP